MIINFNGQGGGTPSPTPGGKQYFKPVDKLPASADEKGTTVYVKEDNSWDSSDGGITREGYYKWNGERWEESGLIIRTMAQGEYDVLPDEEKNNSHYLFNITE